MTCVSRLRIIPAESIWAATAKQVFAATVCTEMGGAASAIIGGLGVLRAEGGLSTKQEETVETLTGSAQVRSREL